MRLFFDKYGLFLAWLVALMAMIATLIMEYVLQWPVCELCWYQRIALYPLVILLGIAAYRQDKNIIPYAMTLSAIGFIVALYQYLEQMIPGFSPIAVCTTGVSCSTIHLQLLGFMTLPFFSMMICVIIFVCLWLSNIWKTRL
ncbi:MAG TPA: disulfide bond formation protein B [Coxiellaceae bacterium]|nr:disulfide bond formation protein B [Coxiellaceae bacterium]